MEMGTNVTSSISKGRSSERIPRKFVSAKILLLYITNFGIRR